jgi:antirestriction protein ArdC/phage/plasmid primase-like uncharacterized protein
MAVDTQSRQPAHEVFAEKIIEALKKGTAPWQKPWKPGELLAPMNPVSGTIYHGINRVMLSGYEYDDPRWMTLKQANSIGCRVRKGEKSQPIVYWQFTKEVPARDDAGKPVLNEDGSPRMVLTELPRPLVRFSSIFHVSQLDGDVPPLDPSAKTRSWDPNEKAEEILQRSGAVIFHTQRDKAFYRPSSDEIRLPPKDHFPTADAYYSTALHELGHWTGHESRLDREGGPFGSEPYAREELRAEIASWMLAQDLGLGHDPSEHLSYVGSWIKALEQDPYEIVRACRDAEKIKQYIMDIAMEKEHPLGLQREASFAAGKASEAEAMPQAQALPEESATMAQRAYLVVPYREKDLAKGAGAKWDRTAKLWYAPEGADMARLQAWLPRESMPPATPMDPREEFGQTLRAAGLDLGGRLPAMDGTIHRVPVTGRPKALDGAYQGFLDGHPAGWYQNYVTGEKATWKANGHVLSEDQKQLLIQEAKERQSQREHVRLLRQDNVARRCREAFEALPPIRPIAEINHPYLLRKGVPPLGGIKESPDGRLLLVPLYNAQGEIRNVQEIDWDGNKRFQKDGQKQGCFFMIDSAQKLKQGEIILAEGYVTGVSINMATEKPVAVAFDAGNLEPVARALREKFPEAKITICADNDHARDRGNIGVERAKEAAQNVGGTVIIPIFNNDELKSKKTDFNDLHQSRGLKEVAAQILKGMKKNHEHDFDFGMAL